MRCIYIYVRHTRCIYIHVHAHIYIYTYAYTYVDQQCPKFLYGKEGRLFFAREYILFNTTTQRSSGLSVYDPPDFGVVHLSHSCKRSVIETKCVGNVFI